MMQLTMCEEYNVYSGKVLNILYDTYVYYVHSCGLVLI